MTGPEIVLEHPVELDGTLYDKLTVASYDAIASFECHNAPRVILSLARVYGVPRKVIRHLHPDDTNRAGDLIRALLDEVAHS
ncbi:phage tail assembly protein [Nitrobacter sp.]|uniref:phage tail assembly protein n=1 Tax=Nitrobacter sp. TaxID=29420 RepID=UPI0029CABCC8|nr:phage tail assembly protein [Nitrobacter sp.]